MEFTEYEKDFVQTLRNDAAISGTDAEDEFIDKALSLLADYDELTDPVKYYFGKAGQRGRLMQINGFSFDEVEHSLNILISDFENSFAPSNLVGSQVDSLYWKMYYFLDEVCNGNIGQFCDDSDDCLKVARMIRKRMNALQDDPELILKVKFYILTNKKLDTKLLDKDLLENSTKKKSTKSSRKIKKVDFNEKPLEINLWPIERFFEIESSNSTEPIIIDFVEDFNCKGIPYINGEIGENLGYCAYIAIIPGKLLADIYIEHGSKVLEGNVRAFLGTNSQKSINFGIKKTINIEPTKFFTYNNGIATTAAGVEINYSCAEPLITKIIDFQIINGGQTTATLAEAVLKKSANANLNGIYVPMKLTVIEDRETEDEDGVRFYDKMVQDIAKYANSQNKVSAADLLSNDPFHIWMEKMSKKHLSPPVQYPVPTGWYYERSRKKYLREQEQIQNKSGKDESNRFQKKFPKNQIIDKEQLAMYLTTISCKPSIVSKGKNWVIKEFGEEIRGEYIKNKAVFNELYFKKCICAAIVFRAVDHYLETNKDSAKKKTNFWYKAGGYKSDIVPYSIAKMLNSIPKRYTLNWEKIWQKQNVSTAFLHEVEVVTKMTNDFICNSHSIIVHEYCKRTSTWEEYRDTVEYKPSNAFLQELLPLELAKEQEASAKNDQRELDELQVVIQTLTLGADYWNELLEEGSKRNMLTYQEQSTIKQIVTMASTGDIPASSFGKVPIKTMSTIKAVHDIKNKLEAEGIKR